MKAQSTQSVNYSIRIHAPKEKVWETMLNEETYREWTSPFTEGSHYKGSWEKGSEILFLDPKGEGMVSKIVENKPYEFISIEHVGLLKDGKQDTESADAMAMAGVHENYTFTQSGGITEVSVDMDMAEEYKTMFDESWPKALSKLKELCEN